MNFGTRLSGGREIDMTRKKLSLAIAPFQVRSFRFQWPADLLTSWAFEMETLILAWYVLVETNSIFWLTLFGSLQFLGTLVAPIFGLLGDRLGRRKVLCSMRAAYSLIAAIIMTLAFAGSLSVYYVFLLAFCSGMIRPSDLVMRNALIGDTMQANRLTNALSISRTTMDSARIAGALSGAGLFSQLGLGNAYMVVVAIYLASFTLTLAVAGSRGKHSLLDAQTSPWEDLKQGLKYVWETPVMRAIMSLAFLVNFTAYPIFLGLLPYIARKIYQVDENGLSYLVAAFASGALIGSLVMIIGGRWRKPNKIMIYGIAAWHLLILAFASSGNFSSGLFILVLAGMMQSMAMIAMSVMLIELTEPAYRGRVMGLRILAVYGLPLGLFVSSPLIANIGFSAMAYLYGLAGLALSTAIVIIYRHKIW
jgi:predicted MFS family arabinose efflux permease